jgi:hypothetical protein
LSQDATEEFPVQVVAECAWHCDGSRLRRMMELPVASSIADLVPPIFLKFLDDVSHFHEDIRVGESSAF